MQWTMDRTKVGARNQEVENSNMSTSEKVAVKRLLKENSAKKRSQAGFYTDKSDEKGL